MLINGVELKVGDTLVSSRGGKNKFIIPKAFAGDDEATDEWLQDQILKNQIPDVYRTGVWFFRVIESIDGDNYNGTIYNILNPKNLPPSKRNRKKRIYCTLRR